MLYSGLKTGISINEFLIFHIKDIVSDIMLSFSSWPKIAMELVFSIVIYLL